VGARRRAVLLAVPLVCLLACQRGAGRLAVVANRTVTMATFSSFVVAQTGRSLQEVSPELAGALFERYLEEEVILTASATPGVTDLSPTSRTARARELLTSLCPPPPQPSDAQVEAYLAQHHESVAAGESLRLRQLILPDQATAQVARDRIRAGEDFVAVSRTLSRAPNAATGGLLGWVERGQLAPEFQAAVFGLAPGELSNPVPSNAGWHVFQVMERQAPGAGPNASTRDRVRGQLAAEAAEAARTACLRQLARRVGVHVDCAGVSFPCKNPFEGEP
jgi:PPIC-type PPIASE domain